MNEAISYSANKDKLQYIYHTDPYAPEPTGVNLWYRLGTSQTVLLSSCRQNEGLSDCDIPAEKTTGEQVAVQVTSPFPGSSVQANQLTSSVTSCNQANNVRRKYTQNRELMLNLIQYTTNACHEKSSIVQPYDVRKDQNGSLFSHRPARLSPVRNFAAQANLSVLSLPKAPPEYANSREATRTAH